MNSPGNKISEDNKPLMSADLPDSERSDKDIDDDADVPPEEKELLRKGAEEMPNPDDEDLQQSFLDDKDDDGDPLNEKSSANNLSGSDLDIPGAELDDDNEEIGEEDEENNAYSQADTE